MKKSHRKQASMPDQVIASLKLYAPGFPEPEREYQFCADVVGHGPGIRQRLKEAGLKAWRFDLAWKDVMLAVECEGGAFVGGRHTRGVGFSDDLIKYGTAMEQGWIVYRCDQKMIKSGQAIDQIIRVYARQSAITNQLIETAPSPIIIP